MLEDDKTRVERNIVSSQTFSQHALQCNVEFEKSYGTSQHRLHAFVLQEHDEPMMMNMLDQNVGTV